MNHMSNLMPVYIRLTFYLSLLLSSIFAYTAKCATPADTSQQKYDYRISLSIHSFVSADREELALYGIGYSKSLTEKLSIDFVFGYGPDSFASFGDDKRTSDNGVTHGSGVFGQHFLRVGRSIAFTTTVNHKLLSARNLGIYVFGGLGLRNVKTSYDWVSIGAASGGSASSETFLLAPFGIGFNLYDQKLITFRIDLGGAFSSLSIKKDFPEDITFKPESVEAKALFGLTLAASLRFYL